MARALAIAALKKSDPFAAADWYSEASRGQGISIPGYWVDTDVLGLLTHTNPERSLHWALEQPGQEGLKFPRGVLTMWLRDDPAGAERAIGRLDDATARARMMAEYAQVLLWDQTNRPWLQAWVRTLSPNDRSGARKFAASSDFPDSTKNELRALFQP